MVSQKDVLNKREQKLIEKSKQGDAEAFAELIKAHEKKIYGLTLHICAGEKSDAEDVFQETFIKAFKNIKQFRGDAHFGTWLYRIALNECWQIMRKKERTPVVSLLDNPIRNKDGDIIQRDPVDLSPIPEKLFEKKELKDIIHAALNELPETYRVVLHLRDIEGLSTEKTAKVLGETAAAVKSRLHRGRLYLRDKLIRYFSGRKKHPWTVNP